MTLPILWLAPQPSPHWIIMMAHDGERPRRLVRTKRKLEYIDDVYYM